MSTVSTFWTSAGLSEGDPLKRILMVHSILCVIASVLTLDRLQAAASPRTVDKNAACLQASETRFACGARAAVLFCRSHALDVSLSEIASELPVTAAGTSMLDLHRALQERGMPCTLRRLSPRDLQNASLPLIAFYLPSFTGRELGHYVLVTHADETGLMVTDSITGISGTATWRGFSDAWSGHCIIHTGGASRISPIVTGVLCLHVIALTWFLSVCRGATMSTTGAELARRRGRRREQRLAYLIVPALTVLTSGSVSAGEGSLSNAQASAVPQEAIRSHDRDGLNAVILLASLMNCNPAELMRQCAGAPTERRLSILDVQACLMRVSCPTQLRRLTLPELNASEAPAIVLLRHDDIGRAQYSVVLATKPGAVTVVHAGPAIVQEISEDDFRRRWTGHALLPVLPPDRRRLASSGLAGAACGAACMGLAVFVRRHRTAKLHRDYSET